MMRIKYEPLPLIFINSLKLIHISIDPFFLYSEGLRHAPSYLSNPPQKGIDIRLLDKNDMKYLVAFGDRDASLSLYNKRIDNGEICLGALIQGQIIAFTWANLNQFSFKSYTFPLASSEAYLHDAYTSIEYRGKKIAGYLRYKLYEKLADLGRYMLYSITIQYNKPALRYKEKIGAYKVDSGTLVNIWGMDIGSKPNPIKLRKNFESNKKAADGNDFSERNERSDFNETMPAKTSHNR